MADIDLVVSELREVLEVRKGRWPTTLGHAPRLLEDSRYETSADRIADLARDLTAAIARLPAELRHGADVLLDITTPRTKTERWQAIGAEEYSGDARKYLATTIFTRVAVELLGLWSESGNTHSYRLVDLDIDVVVQDNSTFREGQHERCFVLFRWTIVPTVADLAFFSFYHRTLKPFAVKKLRATFNAQTCEPPAYRDDIVDREPRHWLGIILPFTPKSDTPAKIEVLVEYHSSDPHNEGELTYVPTRKLDTLGFGLTLPPTMYPHDDSRHLCQERSGAHDQRTRTFPSIMDDTERVAYSITEPRQNLKYTLSWNKR
jgi:hypothetical protein